YFSSHMTLLPGDILATGTPPGVGFGKNRVMKVRDVLECGIANLGSQRHEITSLCGRWESAARAVTLPLVPQRTGGFVAIININING
ncbi:fumarylacetoacetate hydrolase family protein, partial [Acinetobacter baumannii]